MKEDKNKNKAAEDVNEESLADKHDVKEPDYAKLQEELASYKDKYVRLFAEFDNARKRMDKEKQEFLKYANEGLLVEFLGILDNLELSVQAAKEKHQDYDAFLKGIEMVMAHAMDLLKKNNVKPLEAKGKKFDPHCHEVLYQEPNEDVEEGTVLEELQKGYSLGDRVIRTSKVKLSKKP
jgi:molecular chaperone GrpE